MIEMEKPTIEQTAWVFEKLCEHLFEGGSFRYLIHDRMGYGTEAYQVFYEAGGMVLNNALYDSRKKIACDDET